MQNTKQILYIILILIISSTVIYSQNSGVFGKESIAIHPKAGLLFNYYTSDYKSFQGTVDCGVFTFGKGWGWDAALVIEKDFGGTIQLGLGAGLFNRSGNSTLNNTFQSRDQNTGRTTFVTLENKMEATLSYLEISPELRLVLTDNFINGPFRMMVGFRAGIPVTKEYAQSESVVSPSNATFINSGGERTTVRQMASGTINTATTQFGVSFGFENLLKIGNHNYLTQQIIFDYNFNNIVNDAEWKTFAVRLDVGLRFSIQESEKPIIKELELEPVKEEIIVIKEEPKPLPYLNFSGDFADNMKLETGNELLATLPLVNSVFFEKNSSEIPSYYSRKAGADVDMYKGNPVEYHKHILEVITKIVNENPGSRIMIEGATSGLQNEPKGLELAKSRAETVKNAFIELGVPASKISYRALMSPRFPASQQYADGISENQRVDIIVQDAPLQQYVNLEKYAELNGDYLVNIDYGNYAGNPKAMTTVNKQNISYDKPGKYRTKIKERIGIDDKDYVVNSKVNVDGSELSETKKLELTNVPKTVVELQTNNFEALLRFNYNSSDLTEENQTLLRQLVQKLPDGATILIIGSADILGTAEHNQQLANDRARKTEAFIKNISGSRIKTETTTYIDKFPDTTPQGRFLNRSIKIRVK